MTSPHLDSEILQTLRCLASEDEPEFFGKLMTRFSDSIDGKLNQIRKALDQSELQTVVALSHQFKSGCFNIGAKKMGELCIQLERITDQMPYELQSSLFLELQSCAHLTQKEIENIPEVISFRSRS